VRGLAFVVAAAGAAVAAYLTIVHYAGGTPVCAIAHGCEVVQQSRYAELAGVPVALLGLLGYLAILLALWRDARTVAATLALTGFAFSGWLTYVEIERLEAICTWCVASAACMTALAAITTRRLMLAG